LRTGRCATVTGEHPGASVTKKAMTHRVGNPSPDISHYLRMIDQLGGRFSRVFDGHAAPWRLRRDESWDFSGAAATAKKGSRRARG
jgi:hypothetical protein